jgi:hypothetical protein
VAELSVAARWTARHPAIRDGIGMTFEFTLYDPLLSIDVPAERARAVIDALEHDMGSTLATKQDISALAVATKQDIAALAQATGQHIQLLRQEVKQEIVLVKQQLEHRIDLLQSSMTIRLGSILVVAMGLLFAALKLS